MVQRARSNFPPGCGHICREGAAYMGFTIKNKTKTFCNSALTHESRRSKFRLVSASEVSDTEFRQNQRARPWQKGPLCL